MAKIGEKTFNGHKVLYRELTVAQVDAIISSIEEQAEPTTLDWMFADKYLPQSTLEIIIDQPVAEIMDAETSPSDLEEVYKEAVRYNPFLCGALTKMRTIADLMKMDLMRIGSGLQPSTLLTGDTTESGNIAFVSSMTR